jgi:protein-disulfide isomerase
MRRWVGATLAWPRIFRLRTPKGSCMPTAKAPAGRPGTRPSKPRRSNRRLLVIGAPIAAIAIFAGVLIAVHFATSSSSGSKVDVSNLQFVANAKAEFAGIPSKGNTVGYASAPVTVVEYGDLRCPVCREFDSTVIPDVLQKLVRTKQAKLVYQHWPILGPNSEYASRAAYAAEKQNKLWEFALVTYYNQGNEQQSWFTKAFADAVATSIGLNMPQFNKDFDDTSASAAQIKAVNAAAAAHQFTGTPSILITRGSKSDDLGGATPTYSDIQKAVAKLAAA